MRRIFTETENIEHPRRVRKRLAETDPSRLTRSSAGICEGLDKNRWGDGT